METARSRAFPTRGRSGGLPLLIVLVSEPRVDFAAVARCGGLAKCIDRIGSLDPKRAEIMDEPVDTTGGEGHGLACLFFVEGSCGISR